MSSGRGGSHSGGRKKRNDRRGGSPWPRGRHLTARGLPDGHRGGRESFGSGGASYGSGRGARSGHRPRDAVPWDVEEEKDEARRADVLARFRQLQAHLAEGAEDCASLEDLQRKHGFAFNHSPAIVTQSLRVGERPTKRDLMYAQAGKYEALSGARQVLGDLIRDVRPVLLRRLTLTALGSGVAALLLDGTELELGRAPCSAPAAKDLRLPVALIAELCTKFGLLSQSLLVIEPEWAAKLEVLRRILDAFLFQMSKLGHTLDLGNINLEVLKTPLHGIKEPMAHHFFSSRSDGLSWEQAKESQVNKDVRQFLYELFEKVEAAEQGRAPGPIRLPKSPKPKRTEEERKMKPPTTLVSLTALSSMSPGAVSALIPAALTAAADVIFGNMEQSNWNWEDLEVAGSWAGVLGLSEACRARLVGLAGTAARAVDIRVASSYASLLQDVYAAIPGGLEPRVAFLHSYRAAYGLDFVFSKHLDQEWWAGRLQSVQKAIDAVNVKDNAARSEKLCGSVLWMMLIDTKRSIVPILSHGAEDPRAVEAVVALLRRLWFIGKEALPSGQRLGVAAVARLIRMNPRVTAQPHAFLDLVAGLCREEMESKAFISAPELVAAHIWPELERAGPQPIALQLPAAVQLQVLARLAREPDARLAWTGRRPVLPPPPAPAAVDDVLDEVRELLSELLHLVDEDVDLDASELMHSMLSQTSEDLDLLSVTAEEESKDEDLTGDEASVSATTEDTQELSESEDERLEDGRAPLNLANVILLTVRRFFQATGGRGRAVDGEERISEAAVEALVSVTTAAAEFGVRLSPRAAAWLQDGLAEFHHVFPFQPLLAACLAKVWCAHEKPPLQPEMPACLCAILPPGVIKMTSTPCTAPHDAEVEAGEEMESCGVRSLIRMFSLSPTFTESLAAHGLILTKPAAMGKVLERRLGELFVMTSAFHGAEAWSSFLRLCRLVRGEATAVGGGLDDLLFFARTLMSLFDKPLVHRIATDPQKISQLSAVYAGLVSVWLNVQKETADKTKSFSKRLVFYRLYQEILPFVYEIANRAQIVQQNSGGQTMRGRRDQQNVPGTLLALIDKLHRAVAALGIVHTGQPERYSTERKRVSTFTSKTSQTDLVEPQKASQAPMVQDGAGEPTLAHPVPRVSTPPPARREEPPPAAVSTPPPKASLPRPEQEKPKGAAPRSAIKGKGKMGGKMAGGETDDDGASVSSMGRKGTDDVRGRGKGKDKREERGRDAPRPTQIQARPRPDAPAFVPQLSPPRQSPPQLVRLNKPLPPQNDAYRKSDHAQYSQPPPPERGMVIRRGGGGANGRGGYVNYDKRSDHNESKFGAASAVQALPKLAFLPNNSITALTQSTPQPFAVHRQPDTPSHHDASDYSHLPHNAKPIIGPPPLYQGSVFPNMSGFPDEHRQGMSYRRPEEGGDVRYSQQRQHSHTTAATGHAHRPGGSRDYSRGYLGVGGPPYAGSNLAEMPPAPAALDFFDTHQPSFAESFKPQRYSSREHAGPRTRGDSAQWPRNEPVPPQLPPPPPAWSTGEDRH